MSAGEPPQAVPGEQPIESEEENPVASHDVVLEEDEQYPPAHPSDVDPAEGEPPPDNP